MSAFYHRSATAPPQGLASEGSRELIRHGFEDLGLHRIFAQTMTVNAASRVTMASLGMQFVRSVHEYYEDPAASTARSSTRSVVRTGVPAEAAEPHRRTSPRSSACRTRSRYICACALRRRWSRPVEFKQCSAEASISRLRLKMQPLPSGSREYTMRVRSGSGGESVRVTARRPSSYSMTSRIDLLPATSMKHCCSPTPSGVPGTLNPCAICRGNSTGPFSAGWMSAHTSSAVCCNSMDSWTLSVRPSEGLVARSGRLRSQRRAQRFTPA